VRSACRFGSSAAALGSHGATRHVFDTVGPAGECLGQRVGLCFTLGIAFTNNENAARTACIELSRR